MAKACTTRKMPKGRVTNPLAKGMPLKGRVPEGGFLPQKRGGKRKKA
jgi:hypothetical protein